MPLQPVIILVQPQLGENIGATARAMANCGLDQLRLVNPRDGWPNPNAEAASSGATDILAAAKLFDTTRDAIGDLQYVLASTARSRDLVKPVVTPLLAVQDIHVKAAQGLRTGILFGAERTGLLNDDVGLSDAILTVPLNPAFTSLNLAQAVLLIGYEWYRSTHDGPESFLDLNGSQPATKQELINCFEHLEEELVRSDFFKNPLMRPTMVANLRAMLQRAQMTEQEVRTFHGLIVALTGRSRIGRVQAEELRQKPQ